MAALISSVMNTKDRVPYYVQACEEMGIEVLPPDVNVSAAGFAVVDGKIRFGLSAVKNVGDNAAVEAVIAARKETTAPITLDLEFLRASRPAGSKQAVLWRASSRRVRSTRPGIRARACWRYSRLRSRAATATTPTD